MSRDKLDRYYTPDDLARVLVRRLVDDYPRLLDKHMSGLEPSAGDGAFLRAAADELWTDLLSLDIDEDQLVDQHCDFLTWSGNTQDLVVGNPPFSNVEAHVRKALSVLAPSGVCGFLLRLAFLESSKRQRFWAQHPARRVVVLSERPSFTDGGTDSSAYGFFVWERGYRGPTELEVMSWK